MAEVYFSVKDELPDDKKKELENEFYELLPPTIGTLIAMDDSHGNEELYDFLSTKGMDTLIQQYGPEGD